jgi:hypothetical protein
MSPDYTFAITVVGNDVRPLAFTGEATEYRHEQLQGYIGTSLPSPGSTSNNLDEDNEETDESLPLLKFIIGNGFGATSPCT